MNDRERFNLIEQQIQVLQRGQGRLETALQYVWTWMISNKGFFDSLPFTTAQKPPEEPKKEGVIVPEIIKP